MPESIDSVVSIPSAMSSNLCDRLAAQVTKAAHGKTIRTVLRLEMDAVSVLMKLGILGTKAADMFANESEFGVWEVPATIEAQNTREPHVDAPADGLPFAATTLVYLTDAKGALHFPTTNESVAIKKGSVVAFPAGTVHAVLDSEPRIFLGPFTESFSPRHKRRLGHALGPLPFAWLEKRGCCRQRVSGVPKRKRFLSHHDNLIDETEIVGGTMANAMDRCQEDCLGNDLCTAFEVHKSKKTKAKNAKKSKKRSKGYKCELHKAAINDASRKSKSCKKAQCFIRTGTN